MFSLEVVKQPPVNVRTGTLKEKRQFKITVRVFASHEHERELELGQHCFMLIKMGIEFPRVLVERKSKGFLLEVHFSNVYHLQTASRAKEKKESSTMQSFQD